MPEIDWTALCEETSEHLEIDQRFWSEAAGSFEWHGRRVYFEKTPDSIILEVAGERRECGRP